MDLLSVFDSIKVHFEKSRELIAGIHSTIECFKTNKDICMKCVKSFFSQMNEEEGKTYGNYYNHN